MGSAGPDAQARIWSLEILGLEAGVGWGGESLFKKATQTAVTGTGQERGGGRVGHRPGPGPRCMRTHARSLPVEEEGFWAGSTFQT